MIMVEKYSVLMSVYKKEQPDFLRESMQSIYEQTAPTDDFVLVCDGPLTDRLDAVINEMQKKFGKRLKVLRQKKNHGLGYSLNLGVKECKNDLIARMDSDDVSMKERIEKELVAMKENNADVVGSNVIEFDENMLVALESKDVPEKDSEIKRYAKKRNPMNHMSVCYKKKAIIECGNYVEMMGFEDYYLWIRMIQKGKVFYNVQEPLVKVRAGVEMSKRRGGLRYCEQIKDFEMALRKTGFVSPIECYYSMLVRMVIALVPVCVRKIFYKKILRRKVNDNSVGIVSDEKAF